MQYRGLAAALCVLSLCGCNKPPVEKNPVANAQTPPATQQEVSGAPAAPGTWGDAKDFTFKTFDGKSIKLSSLGGKPLVVNFWATWCPPCVGELPDIAEVYKAKGSQFQLVGIASDDSEDPEGFVKKNGYNWTFGRSPEAFTLYKIDAIPMTLFIDSKGNIVDKTVGGMQKAEFEEKLAKII
jgi:thiol-disulfide isomerase/thioredoxin